LSLLHVVLMLIILALLLLVFVLLLQIRKIKREKFVVDSIYKASKKLPEMGSRREFIKYVCKIEKDITKANEFVYFRYNEENDLLIPVYAESPYKEQILHTTLRLGEGFTGKVALSRKGGILNHATKSNISKHVPNTPKDDSSLLAIPMIFNKTLLGAILLVKLDGTTFREEDLRLSEIFVNIVSGFFFTKNLIFTIQEGVVQLIVALVKSVEYKDPYTAGHSIRVGHFSEILARTMGLSDREVLIAKIGGFLHDIGKIAIEDEILKRKTNLRSEDWKKIREHPKIGADVVSKFRFLKDVIPCILYHHKWFDGRGYPENIDIKGKDIPICGRIVAVADALDAITTERPGYSARSLQWAIYEIAKKRGTQFDPDVVDALIRSSREISMFVRKEFSIEDTANYDEIVKIL